MKRISFLGALALMMVGVVTLTSFTTPGQPDKKKGQAEYKREVKVTTPI